MPTQDYLPSPSQTASDGLRIEVARLLEALQPYETAWNRLAFDSQQQWPGLSYAWVVSHWEGSPEENWRCLLALQDEELVGVLPVVMETDTWLGLKRQRLSTPHRRDISSVDFLTARGREADIIPRLLEALNREFPAMHDFFVPMLPATSPSLALLKEPTMDNAFVQEFAGLGAYLPVSGSFQQYHSRLGKHFRQNLARARIRLDQLPDVRVVVIKGHEATENELDSFLALEASGWKGRAGTAIKSKPALHAFYRRLARRLGELGWLEWSFLMSGDQALAGQLSIVLERSRIDLHVAYDETFARYSPGHLLAERVLESVFAARNTQEINWVTDMRWEHSWGVQTRPYHHLWIYPNRFLPLASGALAKRIKTVLQRVPGLASVYRRLRGWRKR